MYPEKSFFCNFCGSSKANRITSQRPAKGRLTGPSYPALPRHSMQRPCIAAGFRSARELVMHQNLCVFPPTQYRFSLIGPNGQGPLLPVVLKKIAFLLAGRIFCGYTDLRPENQAREPTILLASLGSKTFPLWQSFRSNREAPLEKCI